MNINNDLTFFTNEPDRTLLDRFKNLIGDDTKAFDVLVGYFNISGFHLLSDVLENVDNIRILVGMGIDQNTFKSLNQIQFDYKKTELVQEEIEKAVINEIQNSEDKFEVEDGIKKFINWLKEGKIHIKAYPENLHAKVYILSFDSSRDAGRVITGSSNFTLSGLKGNLEFNVELKNYADYKFALDKFNQLWEEAVDIREKVIDTVVKKTWVSEDITPYMLYLKFLYEYFKEEIDDDKKDTYFRLPSNFIELQYQKDAVIDAEKKLNRYNGVIISDVVGLGKTFITALLMKKLNGRFLVIVPPRLIDNWKSVLFDFGIPAEIVSSGILSYKTLDYQKLLDREFDYVIIDEAHQFRNEDTQKYDALKNLCIDRKLILITATPYNNKPLDILSLLKLFQNPRYSDFLTVRNLEEYFKKLDKKLTKSRKEDNYKEVARKVADDIRENVLKYILIRRTRKDVQEFYEDDLKKNKLTFPKVEDPEPIFYELDDQLEELFDYTVEVITQKLTYARYKPLLYEKDSIDPFIEESQKNLAGFMKAILIKRLESSFEAFKSTLNNILKGYEFFISLIEEDKYVYFSKKHFNKIREYIEKGDYESVQSLIEIGRAEKIHISKFKKSLKKDLNSDRELLRDLKERWDKVKNDPKLEELKDTLKNLKGKIILFTESEKTLDYLYQNLSNFRAFKFTGSSSRADVEKVRMNFDANVKKSEQLNDYDILITTDVLSEGVNLHRSNIVINYDIPWNPVRLIQRIGRINRVGTKFEKIYIYNFFPTHQAENEIELKKIAEMKMHTIIQMLGSDAKFLTEDEEVDSHRLFEMLNSNELFEGDEGINIELRYLQDLRRIRDNNPELFNKIKKIPQKARVGRKSKNEKDKFVVFIKKADMKKMYYIDNTEIPQEISFEKAVNIFSADEKEKSLKIPKEFYHYLNMSKHEFEREKQLNTTPKGIEKDLLMLIAKLKNSRPTAWTMEELSFFNDIGEIIKNGMFSKYRMRMIKEKIEPEIKKKRFKEAFQILKELVPQSYIQYLRHKKEEKHYATEIILSEIFV
ncbi:helicase-related protein [Persephonella sp.]